MIDIDIRNKKSWNLFKANYSDGIVLQKGGKAVASSSCSDNIKIKMLFKKKSGDGIFFIKILDENKKIFYEKRLRGTTGCWSELSEELRVPSGTSSLSISLEKPANSFGRVQIGRLKITPVRNLISQKNDIVKKELKAINLDFFEEVINIAVIVPYSIYGGAEVYLKNIFERKHKNVNVDFLLIKPNKISDLLKNVNFISVRSLNQIEHIINLKNYNSIIFYNSKNIYNILKTLKSKKRIQSELVEIYHSDFRWSDSLSSVRNRECVSKMIRVSDSLANNISGDFDLKTIPVSIDVNKFSRGKISLRRSHLGVKNTNPIFGLVARLSPEKNIDYAFDIFSKINNANLVVFGTGPLLNHLSLRIKREGLENIKLMNHKEDMPMYYPIFDALILTSKMEGTPITIVEALSFEIPVFTTNVGGIKAHFESCGGVNFLSGELNKDCSLISSFCRNMSLSTEARDFVLKNHSLEVNSNKFFKFIQGNNIEFEQLDRALPLLFGEWI